MGLLGFVGGAVILVFFMFVGRHPALLFGLLFAASAFSFGLLALITGPISAEAAPPGMISTAAGLVIGVGEVFGGGLALVVAGAIISRYGIDHMLDLAIGGLFTGALIMLFLRETAPRLVQERNRRELLNPEFVQQRML
jgi:sugar phosphate permease